MLTSDEAKQLALSKLKSRSGRQDLFTEDDRTIEREFGWVFFVRASDSGVLPEVNAVLQGPIIVNKHVGQVIASSTVHPLERFIEIYETLLAKSQTVSGDWCMTSSYSIPWSGFRLRRLKKKAKEAGFYEIR